MSDWDAYSVPIRSMDPGPRTSLAQGSAAAPSAVHGWRAHRSSGRTCRARISGMHAACDAPASARPALGVPTRRRSTGQTFHAWIRISMSPSRRAGWRRVGRDTASSYRSAP